MAWLIYPSPLLANTNSWLTVWAKEDNICNSDYICMSNRPPPLRQSNLLLMEPPPIPPQCRRRTMPAEARHSSANLLFDLIIRSWAIFANNQGGELFDLQLCAVLCGIAIQQLRWKFKFVNREMASPGAVQPQEGIGQARRAKPRAPPCPRQPTLHPRQATTFNRSATCPCAAAAKARALTFPSPPCVF